MIRGVLGSRASIGGVLGSGRGGAAAAWYLAGGVSAANCIAAYTPIGAASLAASYDNNAAPGNGLADGTYDAAPGVAPAFDTATGWAFVSGSSTYLTTGITPGNGWSLIVKYSGVTATGTPDQCLIGSTAATDGARFYINVTSPAGATKRYYGYGSAADYGGASIAAGVIALAGGIAYIDGVAEKTISSSITATGRPLFIAARNNGTATNWLATAQIQACAIYNTKLDAATVAAISAAMAAL